MDAEVRDERVMMDKNRCVGKAPFYKFSHSLPSRRGKSTSLAQREQSEPRPRQWSWQKTNNSKLKKLRLRRGALLSLSHSLSLSDARNPKGAMSSALQQTRQLAHVMDH